MKIRTLSIYTFAAFAMLAAYMLGPTLFYLVGIPRIDNPLTLLFIFVVLLAFIRENKQMPRSFAMAFLALIIMSGWSLLHLLISPLSATTFADLMLFAVLPCYACLLYWIISRHPQPIRFIRRFLATYAAFIILPALIELMSGFQFVFGDEALTIETGTIKGLFFNPNNLATTALCLTPAILFFFNLVQANSRSRLQGWILFLLLGSVIFAAASRTAISLYLLLTVLFIAYRQNGLTTLLAIGVTALALSLVPSEVIQHFLLSLNGNEFLERFSSRLYLFLYDFGSDNSISYRQEIYDYFRHHPPLLITGYGPRNFIGYFGGHLSNSLGFTNPHSFLIEVYLAFGLVSLFGFLAYVTTYITVTAICKQPSKIRLIAVTSMLIFIVAGFIPSTIMRLPFIWLPNFLILIYIVCQPSWQQRHRTGVSI